MAIQTQGVTRIADDGTLQNLSGLNTVGGISLFGSGNIAATAGTGISVSGTTVTNTGVLSVNGQTGNATVSVAATIPSVYNGVGAFMLGTVPGSANPGDSVSIGSAILSAGQNSATLSVSTANAQPGTWRVMGNASGGGVGTQVTLFLRIA